MPEPKRRIRRATAKPPKQQPQQQQSSTVPARLEHVPDRCPLCKQKLRQYTGPGA